MKGRLVPILLIIAGITALTRLKGHRRRAHHMRPPNPDRDFSRPGEWRWDAW
jgi:hypothetical protein